ncbi:MAG: hypothetical protein K8J08_04430 [Thermoanaerobaculia bacterium]|nr:hypothetical protein [Thermoanaerobaculia bacterium]
MRVANEPDHRVLSAAMPRYLLVVGSLAVICLYALLWSIEYRPEPRGLWGDELRYWEEATDTEPESEIETPPNLLWPPLYSQFVRWTSIEGRSLGAVQGVQALLLLVIAFFSRSLWSAWDGRARGGWILFFLILLYPELTAFSFYLWPEILHLAMLLVIAWILTKHRDSNLWLTALGGLLGLALLTKSLLLPFIPVLLLPLLLDGSRRRRATRVVVVLATMSILVGPVILENGREQGAYVIADSSRFNLWVGLNEYSRRNFDGSDTFEKYLQYQASGDTFSQRNAAASSWTLQLVRERGPLSILASQFNRQYFRLFDRVSFLGDMLPGGAISRHGRGYVAPPPWQARFLRRWSYLLYAAILVLSMLGLTVTPWKDRPWLKMTLLFVLYNLGIFLLLHVKTRYRIQFLPILMLWSVLGVEWILDRQRQMPPVGHWIAGGAIASLLLVFAFGRGLLY